MAYDPGDTVVGAFSVFTAGNVAVTGLVTGDFSILLALDLVDSAVPVSITEIGQGRYGYSFVPPAEGYWYLTIRYAADNPRGWQDEVRVAVHAVGGGGGVADGTGRRRHFSHDAEDRARRQKALELAARTAEQDAVLLSLIAEELTDD